MNVLIIAPHPDDEVIGCGGTIAKMVSAGHSVFVCIVTKPTEDYLKEVKAEKVHEIDEMQRLLGIKKVFKLGFPTQKLDTVSESKLHRAFYDCINEVKPEIIFIPYKNDASNDHRVVFESALFSVRPKPDSFIKKVFSYECLSSTEWNIKPGEETFVPTYYEDISDFLEVKLEAMKVYKSELQEFPHPRSIKGLRVSAEKRGTEAGVKAAEAFMLVREVNRQ